ncbi:MAG TPA: hypothetical protein VNK41_03100 [Vicinamibacterales bacterium]|nr:hypothetical protein [Vicinamibacterales bacterium]
MTDWSPVFLGVIAASVLVMAVLQIGMAVYGARLAQRVVRVVDRVEQETGPLFAHLQSIGADAARASALAAAQVERADQLFADLSRRIEETSALVQTAIVQPAREGVAVVAGLRAALAAIRHLRSAPRRRVSRVDEEDPLFIG